MDKSPHCSAKASQASFFQAYFEKGPFRLLESEKPSQSLKRGFLFSVLFFGFIFQVALPDRVLAEGKRANRDTAEQDEKKVDWLKVPKLEPITPPSAEKIQKALGRGVAFLIESQNKNGSWGAATNTKDLNIYAPIPGSHHAFRAGTTSLALSALIELESDFPQSTSSIDRAEAWLMKHLPQLKRATPEAIYNVWGHLYSIQALSRMHTRHKGR